MVDSTIMVSLNNLAYEQSKATEKKNQAAQILLDYIATHFNTVIRYHASKMQLPVHSGASYLLISKLFSRILGHIFIGNYNNAKNPLMHNGEILTKIAGILKRVMASAAEAESGRLFVKHEKYSHTKNNTVIIGMETKSTNTNYHVQLYTQRV